ncbi:Ribosomal protein S18 acetylase RimI [Microbulbifer donghaiensis]|uniref:Ribosomal protein S18 acetylase RimI n=1 Tax=Microbulbifer donghaiensis TaxID=494016 RepID=A0A1M5D0S7_9GAMM|nr:GNAT family N-acetyltransferase [Microbulbifer donghaiensis]SHF60609.1 Ribosomal protein S18 acetylase RimI [Microbulbifer donghaiensis]
MATSRFTIRPMEPSELNIALQWAAREGWNPGLHDAGCFYAADPQGFFLGLLDDQPVGCVSAVRYGEDFGFLGLYIVDPAHRGEGYGEQLARVAMEHLGQRNMGLDGVVAMQESYRKSGFILAYRNMRYLGLTGQAVGAAPDTHAVVPLSWVPFDSLVAYDRQLFPGPRDAFLRVWINQPDSVALGCVEDEQLRGYGVLRTCQEGYKIGPLFADNSDIAERLYQALTASVPTGRQVFLDIPESNAHALALVERHKMEMVFETARMYSGEDPQQPMERIYGITTFELG